MKNTFWHLFLEITSNSVGVYNALHNQDKNFMQINFY